MLALAVLVLAGAVLSQDPRCQPGDSFALALLNSTQHGRSQVQEVGRFAPGGPVRAADGRLRGAGAACGELPPTRAPWVALVQHGGCPLADKATRLARAGAVAMLLYDPADLAYPDRMGGGVPIDLVTVFTYRWKGEELEAKLLNSSDIHLSISLGSMCGFRLNSSAINSYEETDDLLTVNFRFTLCKPGIPKYNCFHLTSVLFVSISFVILMIISLAWLVFYYIQRFRYMHSKDRLSKQLGSAIKKALSKIPTKTLKSTDKEVQSDGECCAVCIEVYKVQEVLRVLPCRHEFHRSCIDPWLVEHRTCPMCKMDILKYYGYAFTGSLESILQLDIEEPTSLSSDRLSPMPRSLRDASSITANISRSPTPVEIDISTNFSSDENLFGSNTYPCITEIPQINGNDVCDDP